MMNVEEKIRELTEKIRYHEHLYYVKSNPEISDQEFDFLMKELEELEAQNPSLIKSSSPTQRVGEVATSFSNITHRVPMLSIENSYSIADVKSWINRTEKTIDGSVFPICAELKIDGVSASINYNEGLLMQGATRGNGKVGDDITTNLRAIRSLPLSIKSKKDIDIRGEIYTPKSKLVEINNKRIEKEEEPFKNCRNLTSGTIKSLDPNIVSSRGLQIMVYGIAQAIDHGFSKHSETLTFLKDQGFKVNQITKVCNNINEIELFIDDVAEKKNELDFDIDGVVLKIDDLRLQQLLGETSKAPRWIMAYKYPQEQAITTLKSVVWQVGRSQLTPVAIMEPVELGGTTVSRASLHNIDQINEKDIRIGDQIVVEKAGYIIPYVVSALHSKRTGKEKIVDLPLKCPDCNETLIVSEANEDTSNNATKIYCNNLKCPGVLARKIEYSINQMDIENLGPQLIEKLIKLGIVNSLGDILSLESEKLVALERMGEKSANKICKNLQKARKIPLAKLISSLGIPNVGTVVGEKLAMFFDNDFSLFLSTTKDELIKVDGISDVVANNIVNFISDSNSKTDIDFLKQWWLGPDKSETNNTSNKLEGKCFVLTGEAILSRKILSNLIKTHGGTTKSAVSKNIDFLLIGSNEPDDFISSKKTKALQLNIPIIDEIELFRIIGVTIENAEKIGKN